MCRLEVNAAFDHCFEALSMAKPHLPFTLTGLNAEAARVGLTILNLLAAKTAWPPADCYRLLHFTEFR
jgi:hypothetical protein